MLFEIQSISLLPSSSSSLSSGRGRPPNRRRHSPRRWHAEQKKGWQVSAEQHFPLPDNDWKIDIAIVLCNGRTILLLRQFSRLYFQVCFRVHSQAMIGGGRPPYFWAENDGKKKERATRRREGRGTERGSGNVHGRTEERLTR